MWITIQPPFVPTFLLPNPQGFVDTLNPSTPKDRQIAVSLMLHGIIPGRKPK